MKITIRPAPHSKGCAHVGMDWCSKFQGQPLRCETECPDGFCCEMKHCWEVGEKLRDILIARGHEVKMGDEKLRKAEDDTPNRKADMAQLMAWGSELHIALHTNSAGTSVRGVRIGYPMIEKNEGEERRVQRSYKLAECMVKAQKTIYPLPDKVKSCTYNFYELNYPDVPAVYIEGAFANSNEADGRWWHENMDAIATAYADGIEAWIAQEKEEADFDMYQAYVKTAKGGGASIWSDNKKTKKVELLPDGTLVTVTGKADGKGFVPVEHGKNSGVFDMQYLLYADVQPSGDDALYTKLLEIRAMVDEAISMAKT